MPMPKIFKRKSNKSLRSRSKSIGEQDQDQQVLPPVPSIPPQLPNVGQENGQNFGVLTNGSHHPQNGGGAVASREIQMSATQGYEENSHLTDAWAATAKGPAGPRKTEKMLNALGTSFIVAF